MVGNPAFLIRVATALADRAPNSISVRRSKNWVNVWLVAAASRASFSNSRPIVGRRNCRRWVLSKSIVTPVIGTVLSIERSRETVRARRSGPVPFTSHLPRRSRHRSWHQSSAPSFPLSDPGKPFEPDGRARSHSPHTSSGEEDTDRTIVRGAAEEQVEAVQIGARHLD